MINRRFVYIIFLCLLTATQLLSQDHLPLGRSGQWVFLESLSDEFNGENINSQDWDHNPNSWGPWSWAENNAYILDSVLHLRMRYDPHVRNNTDLFYKSGIVRSYDTVTYGYFEARVKGCETFPAASPAFWLYSRNNYGHPSIHYSEIDIIELQQANTIDGVRQGPEHIDMNLHTRIYDENGDPQWIRPKQDPELCKHEWDAPWDPREDFHIYAVESRPDSIFWFIDGIQRAAAENRYWHLPMHITLSLGLRYPHVKWIDGDRFPVPEEATAVGFPTSMKIDYVRSWMLDDVNFREALTQIPTGSVYAFSLDYSAAANRKINIHISDSTGTILGTREVHVSRSMGKLEPEIETSRELQIGETIYVTTELLEDCTDCEEIIDSDTLELKVTPGISAVFKVEDILTGEPLQGALVIFNSSEHYSNEEGRVEVTRLPLGNYTLSVSAKHYDTIPEMNFRIIEDINLTLQMQRVRYTVKYRVEDLKTGMPVEFALVENAAISLNTDLLGIVHSEVPFGKLFTTITRENFDLFRDTLEVNSDTTFEVWLKRIAADVEFRVYHQLALIENVTIGLHDQILNTDSKGTASFKSVPADTILKYHIEKEGFEIIESDVMIDNDSLIRIYLQEEVIGIEQDLADDISVIFNAVSNTVSITGLEKGRELRIYNSSGKVVLSSTSTMLETILDIGFVPGGLYYLAIADTGTYKIIKSK